MNKKISVELSLYADVEITEELCRQIQESSPGYWESVKNDSENLAYDLAFAYLNPSVPFDSGPEDYWDGVCCLDGVVKNIELQ